MSDSKPVYKFINNTWVKQDAFQFTNGSWVRISAATTPLVTPVISLADDILKIQRVANATSYDIYVDNALKNTIDVPKTYNVTLPVASYSYVDNVYCAYSIDDGATWIKMESSETIQTTQIKFKSVGNSFYNYYKR